MSRLATSIAIAVALTIPAAAFACDHDKGEAEAACPHSNGLQCNYQNQAQPSTPDIERLSVAQVVQLKSNAKAQLVDVNSEQTRAKFGVIPGAVLLTSAGDYDAAKELPQAKNQKLIFYCMSERCGASHMAARRAVQAGYTDVAVMPEGITGWRAKGQGVRIPQS
jgi:rhodanese-related sulfurtransferase